MEVDQVEHAKRNRLHVLAHGEEASRQVAYVTDEDANLARSPLDRASSCRI